LSTWIWIIIAIAAVVAVVLVVLGGRRAQERRLEGKRDEAGQLRQEAAARAQSAQHREALVNEQQERLREERAAAEAHARKADEVDPDVPT
jgi:flagellar biosynthesis/type III secretory pathway M-ring protein FliF/YscJ